MTPSARSWRRQPARSERRTSGTVWSGRDENSNSGYSLRGGGDKVCVSYVSERVLKLNLLL